ncbi:PHP-associated domain-containing protein, partial [Bacteroides caccae]|uniref:PHP-associated domain-containing protein n=5 Tax=Pseudomonadati TaxID=3379134 RepID=UPI0012CD9FCF
WHNKCAEQYPDELFLRLAAEMDIPLTISSDAHAPENIGRDFDRAAELARRAGFRQLASFDSGSMLLHPLN